MCFEDGRRRSDACGETLLARYEIGAGPRELVGYYSEAGVSVFDRAVGSGGRGVFVDGGLLWREAVEQLVADYVECAVRTDSVPCGAEALRAILRWSGPGGEGR